MACMEHICKEPGCDWAAIDNEARTSCPKHPGNTMHCFDEPTHDEDFDDDEDDEDDYDRY